MTPNKIVLAYSGGLDTSVAIHWLKENYRCPIIAYCADVGQEEDLAAVEKKARATGAAKVVVADLRASFVQDYVFAALRNGAVYEGTYLLGTALARPCIVHGLMETARAEGAQAVAHGATGKGNDQVRFELAAYHFDPHIRVIAPWREWAFRGRSQLLSYAAERHIPVEATLEKPYSIDRNLAHTSYEGGVLEDPWREPDPTMFQRTRDLHDTPAHAQTVEIAFENGNPVAIDGEALAPTKLLEILNRIAGGHGIGRVDIVENRFVGLKSRGVYETPGLTVLHHAHRAVASLTLDRDVMHLRDELSLRMANLIYNGFWFSPERHSLQQWMDTINHTVTGVARLKLHHGNLITTGRKSPNSLYRADLSTFEEDGNYNQRDATGFIRLQALRLRLQG